MAGWEPGQVPTPHPPCPPKRALAPSDWGWDWGSQDSGRGNSAVCWLRLETSPRGAPSRPPGLRGRPNPSRRGSRFCRWAEVVLILRGLVSAKLGGDRSLACWPGGPGCTVHSHSCLLRFPALAEIRCPEGLIPAKYTRAVVVLCHRATGRAG